MSFCKTISEFSAYGEDIVLILRESQVVFHVLEREAVPFLAAEVAYHLNIARFSRNIHFSPMITRHWRKNVALVG